MATHNVDIRIDTAQSKTSLDSVISSLDQTEKKMGEALKAANQLTQGSDALSKATLAMANSNLKQIASDTSMVKARRDNLQSIVDSLKVQREQVTSSDELQKVNSRLIANLTALKSANQDYVRVVSELDRAQRNYNDAAKPFVDAERQKLELSRRSAEEMQRQKETLRQTTVEAKKREQQQRQEITVLNSAKQSNTQYVQSLRNQFEVMKRGGMDGKVYQNQLKLNSNATSEQRAEVEKLTREIEKMNQTQKSSGGFSAGKLLAGAGIAFGVSQLAQMGKEALTTADRMQALRVRIQYTADTQQEANATFAELINISNTMGTSLEGTAETFNRFAPAAMKLGATQQDVLKFVETLNKIGQVSGASAAEVESAMYQMSQSFASGTLRGQEYMVVSKTMPGVLNALADSLGVSRGELDRMASEGRITAADLLNLKDGTAELDDAFKRLPRSIEQASTSLSNQLSVSIDIINRKFGITVAIAARMDEFAGLVAQINKKMDGTWDRSDELGVTIASEKRLYDQMQKSQEKYEEGSRVRNDLAKLNEQRLERINALEKEQQQLIAKTNAEQKKSNIQAPEDPEVKQKISDAKRQIELAKMSGEERAKAIALDKLGASATKEQREEAAKLALELYNLNEGKKAGNQATKDAARLARQSAKELERDQKANEKYVTELQAKVKADKEDLETAKLSINIKNTLGKSTEDLVFQYRHLTNMQYMNNVAAKTAEAQAKLNKNATEEERLEVDRLVESLERQKVAEQLTGQVSTMQGELQTELFDPWEIESQQIIDQEAQRLAILEEARQADLVSEQEYQDIKTNISKSSSDKRRNFERKVAQETLSAVGGAIDASLDLMKGYQAEQSGIYKAMFIASKAAAIANAMLAMHENIAQASKVGFPWNIATIAGAVAQGVGIIANVRSVSEQFADGGYVSGPGTGRSDSITALLSDGEFVNTSKATSRYRPQLEAMNRGTYNESGSKGSVNVIIENYGNDNVQVDQLDEENIRVMIRQEAPDAIAGAIGDPYSSVNSALNGNYDMSRRV